MISLSAYHGGNDAACNTANRVSPELDAMIDRAGLEADPATYESLIADMFGIVMTDIIPELRLRPGEALIAKPRHGGQSFV